MKFGLIAQQVPEGMIAVLFSFTGIKTCGLDMAILPAAYPYFGPCRRYGKAADTTDQLFITYRLIIEQVGKALSFFDPGNARLLVIHIHQVGRFGRTGIILYEAQVFAVTELKLLHKGYLL